MYRIVRFYKNRGDLLRLLSPKSPEMRVPENQVIKRGLTLEEVQAHCLDPETSSSTCTLPKNVEITEQFGPWFDGYEQY